MAVVLFHLNAAISANFEHWIHPSVQWLFTQGRFGVEVFFVLSGFVIPYSIRNARLGLGFVGRFALRRSIRLDPPYWAAILLETFLIYLGLRVGLADSPLPSTAQFFSHFFYLQNLLGLGDIVDVFWTLCFEIQFYLGLIILFVLGARLGDAVGRRWARPLGAAVLSVLFVVSILGRYQLFGIQIHPGVALIRWYQFFLGTCVYWVVTGKMSWRPLLAAWLVIGVVLVALREPVIEAVPILASALLWWSYQRDQMTTVLSGRVVQFLGAISYSLYLFHASIGWRWIGLLSRYFGSDAALPVVIAAFTTGSLACVGGGWLAWRCIERPAMRFSKVVTFRPNTAAPRDVGIAVHR